MIHHEQDAEQEQQYDFLYSSFYSTHQACVECTCVQFTSPCASMPLIYGHNPLAMSSVVPSHAQIAFATILIKSKPTEFSIEEYIQQLRLTIIRYGRSEITDLPSIIDASLFWKHAYEKLELKNGELMDQISHLEQKDKGNYVPTISPDIARKRKLETDRLTKANTQTKRRKTGTKSTDVKSNEDIVEYSIFPSKGFSTLLRAVYNLRIALDSEATTPSTLCQSISVVCYAAEQSFGGIRLAASIQRPPFNDRASYDEFSDLFIRCWKIVTQALQMDRGSNEKQYAKCIPAIVSLFQSLLGQIQQMSLDEADRRVKWKNKQKTKAQPPVDHWKDVCDVISRLCCQMLTTLDMEAYNHVIAFQGMVCALLDHMGSSISLLVFADKRQAISRQTGLMPPRGLLDVAHLDSATALLTTQIASPYLILILRRAKSVLGDMDVHHHQEKSTSLNPSTSLLDQMRRKLQDTLLRGVFGDEDATFGEALDRANSVNEKERDDLLRLLEQEEDMPVWFIGQVWEHIGWDALSTE